MKFPLNGNYQLRIANWQLKRLSFVQAFPSMKELIVIGDRVVSLWSVADPNYLISTMETVENQRKLA